MANLRKVIYINEEDYSTLINGDSLVIDGTTYTYEENALYVIKNVGPPEYAETAGYATNAGTSLVAVTDASGNNIAATYGKKPLIIDVQSSDNKSNLPSGTYNSITQALSQNKQVVLRMTMNGENEDNDVVYLLLVSDVSEFAGRYQFSTIRGDYTYYGANIESNEYFTFRQEGLSTHYAAQLLDNEVVHKAQTETITGNKTFTGTVSLGSNATATTPAATDNDTSIATTAFVHNVVNAEQVQADWNQTTTTADDYIKNKPGAITNSEIDVIWNEAFGNLITFTVGNTSYLAVKGMTWELFVGSSYDTSNGGFHIMNYSGVYLSDYLLLYSSVIKINNITYMGDVNSQDPIFTEEYNLLTSGGAND